MTVAVKSKRDAVIYLPGLFDSGQITVDAVTKRIAVAFDRNQATGKAQFGLTEGNEFEFEGTSRTRMITVQRSDPGSATKPFVDVYEFDYLETLKEN